MTAKQVLDRVRDFLAAMYGLQGYNEAQFRREVRAVLQSPEGKREQAADQQQRGDTFFKE